MQISNSVDCLAICTNFSCKIEMFEFGTRGILGSTSCTSGTSGYFRERILSLTYLIGKLQLKSNRVQLIFLKRCHENLSFHNLMLDE